MRKIKYVACPWDVSMGREHIRPEARTVKAAELREFAAKRISRFFGAWRAVLSECAISTDVLWVFLAPELSGTRTISIQRN